MILHAISYTKEFGYTLQFCSDLGTNATYYPHISISQEEFEEIWNEPQYIDRRIEMGTTKVLIVDKIYEEEKQESKDRLQDGI